MLLVIDERTLQLLPPCRAIVNNRQRIQGRSESFKCGTPRAGSSPLREGRVQPRPHRASHCAERTRSILLRTGFWPFWRARSILLRIGKANGIGQENEKGRPTAPLLQPGGVRRARLAQRSSPYLPLHCLVTRSRRPLSFSDSRICYFFNGSLVDILPEI